MAKKRKTEIRGVVRCKDCLWYIGKGMLKDRDYICPICDSEMERI